MSDSTVQLVQHQQDRQMEEGEGKKLRAQKTGPDRDCINPKTTLRGGMDQKGLDQDGPQIKGNELSYHHAKSRSVLVP